jgi:hypothetical protein
MAKIASPTPHQEELVDKIVQYRIWSRRMLRLVNREFPRTMEASAHEWPALGAAFIFRATNILDATVELPASHLTAAAILVRSLYEHVVTFAWMATEPSSKAGAMGT